MTIDDTLILNEFGSHFGQKLLQRLQEFGEKGTNITEPAS